MSDSSPISANDHIPDIEIVINGVKHVYHVSYDISTMTLTFETAGENLSKIPFPTLKDTIIRAKNALNNLKEYRETYFEKRTYF
jgi:hypothetical protein